MTAQPRARFSVVSAAYNVAAYLPDFIASIEGQDFDLTRVEVVMVDDGSTDGTLAVLEDWAARNPALVRVVSQPNAGQGAARNAGLAEATGEWVTFPDPDDVLDPNYLSTVDAFLTAHPDTVMAATNRTIWNETAGTVKNSHPLRWMFTYDRLVDLDVAESSFHGSAPAAFCDLDLIREHGLRFDSRIRPNFEDGHFCSSYLLHAERPLVAFLGSTTYHYRKRADQSSSLQGSMLHPGRYTAVFEHGYQAILDEARRLKGHVPMWLQHFVCYELLGYLSVYENARVPIIGAGPELESFHRSMQQIVRSLDLDRVLGRTEFAVHNHLGYAMSHGYDDAAWHSDHVFIDSVDEAQGLVRVRYHFTGALPDEVVMNDERPTGPRHAKTRDFEYFGRILLRERILWVRYAPDLRIVLDGRPADLHFDPPLFRTTRARPGMVRRRAGSPSLRVRKLVAESDPRPTTRTHRAARRLAGLRVVRRTFRDAWVLMDRIHDAGDSGEILFRRLRSHHPEINAWFVIEKGTADWRRLRREFGHRVVAHGSMRWRVLMAHCTNLLSSHADLPIVEPREIVEFTPARWKFTFLQHGVIKDDLSSWLGLKKIDLFVTSTPGEHASIAGDGTRYPFTTKEAQLTGLPRFDRLLEIGARFGPDQRDLVLLTPTWRNWLVQNLELGTQRRVLDDKVLGSDFVRSWMDVVNSPELAEACRRHGLTIGFLPHPNLGALLPRLSLPDHVTALSYEGVDVQELFARARVLVTDYSSIAFNAAFLERPVVYYQFDEDLVLTGGHVGRRGYFDYRRDGFGPVTVSSEEAVAAVLAALEHGPQPAPPYAERVAATFPNRDGMCSERVIAAVLAAGRPDDGTGQVPTPRAVPILADER